MSQEPLLCVTGRFKSVACFDPETLHLKHEIPTPTTHNYRVITIPAEDGRQKELVAAGESRSRSEGSDFQVLLHPPHEIESPFRKLSVSHCHDVCGLCYVTPRLIVSGSGNHDLVVSDVNSGEKVMDLKDAPKCVGKIVSSTSTRRPDGGAPRRRGDGFVFVGGGRWQDDDDDDDALSIRQYDLGRSERATEVVQKFKGHDGWAHGLGYSTEKNLLFSSSNDETLRIWSVHDGSCLQTLQLLNWSYSLLCDPKKQLILCAVTGGIIEVWDYRQTKKRVRKFNHPTQNGYLSIHDVTQIGDGEYASIGDEDYSVATWTDGGKILATAKTSGENYGMCYVGDHRCELRRAEAAAAFEDLMREDDHAKPSQKKNRRTKNRRKKGSRRRRGGGRKKKGPAPRKAATCPPPAAAAAAAVPCDAAAVGRTKIDQPASQPSNKSTLPRGGSVSKAKPDSGKSKAPAEVSPKNQTRVVSKSKHRGAASQDVKESVTNMGSGPPTDADKTGGGFSQVEDIGVKVTDSDPIVKASEGGASGLVALRRQLHEVTQDRDVCRRRSEESDAKLHAAEQANKVLRETLRQRVSQHDAALKKLSSELAMTIGSPSHALLHLDDEDILKIRAHHPYGPFSDTFRRIGRGSYSTVYYWIWKDSPVALKAMNGVGGDAEEVAASIAALRRARHPNLSKLLAYSSKPPFCLVSELYHKTVAEFIMTKQPIDWDVKTKIITDTALGMSHLHACRIVHRDLKWQNVMISHPLSDPKWRACVIDFGCVWIRGTSGRSELPGQGGTVGYKPPEIYETGAKDVTFPADVYAFGIMMYELLGETMEAYGPDFPIADHMAVAAAKLIVEGHRPDPKALRGCVPSDRDWIVRLMENCWSADPLQRFTFQQIVQRLREEGERAKKSVP